MKFKVLFLVLIIFNNCVTLKPPTSIRNGNIENYKYFYITPTNSLSSSYSYTIGGQYYSTIRTINPSDVISGILFKKGIIKLPS